MLAAALHRRRCSVLLLAIAATLALATPAVAQECRTVKTPIGERTECGRGTEKTVCTTVQTPVGLRTTCGQGTEMRTCMATATPVGRKTTCR